MSLLRDRLKVSDEPPAEVDVLIEKARRRHRRRRRAVLAAAVAAIATASLGYGVAGIGSIGRRSSTQTATSSPSAGSPPRASTGAVSDPVTDVTGLGMATASEEWVAADGGVLFSSDQGAHWRKVIPPGARNTIEDVTGYGRNDLWIAMHVGPQGGTELARSTDGGRTWTDLNPQRCLGEKVPDGTCSFDFPRLTFVSPEVGFAISGAVGTAGDTNGNAFYRTTDGGSTWTVIANTCASGPIQFVNSLDGWTLAPVSQNPAPVSRYPSACPRGSPNAQQMELEHTTDGGVTWHSVIPTGQKAATFSSPYFFNVRDGIVGAELAGATPDTELFDVDSTTDGGTTWTVHRVPITPLGTAPSLFPIGPTSWVVVSHGVVASLSRIRLDLRQRSTLDNRRPQIAAFAGSENIVFSSLRDGLANSVVRRPLPSTTPSGSTARPTEERPGRSYPHRLS